MSKITTFLIAEHTPEEGITYTVEERNDQGQVLSFSQYTEEGAPDQRIENDYDDQGRVVEHRQYYQDELAQRVQSEYDAAGKLSRETIIFMDGSKSFRSFERDEANKSILTQLVDEDGTEEEAHYRRLDGEGRVLEEKLINDGNLEHHTHSKYDNHGRLLERRIVDEEGVERSLLVDYQLDEQGRISEAKITNNKGELIRWESIAFDERGNQIDLQYQDHQRGYAGREQWEYDLENRMTLHTRFSGNGQPVAETHFTYDPTGRLLEEEQRTQQGVRILRYQYE